MAAKPRLATVLGALLLSAAVAGASVGSEAGAAMQGKQKSTRDDGSRRICRDITPSGSRLIRRLCRTQAEWDESAQRSQDGLFKQQTETTTTYAAPR